VESSQRCAAFKRPSSKTKVISPVYEGPTSLSTLPSLLRLSLRTCDDFAFRSDRPVTTVNLLGFSRQQPRMPCPWSLAGAVFFALQWVTDFVAGGLQAPVKLEQKVARLTGWAERLPLSRGVMRTAGPMPTAELLRRTLCIWDEATAVSLNTAASCHSRRAFRSGSSDGVQNPWGPGGSAVDHRRMLWNSVGRCMTGLPGHTNDCWCWHPSASVEGGAALGSGALAGLHCAYDFPDGSAHWLARRYF